MKKEWTIRTDEGGIFVYHISCSYEIHFSTKIDRWVCLGCEKLVPETMLEKWSALMVMRAKLR
jgi:hypothetical protein